jgi:iron complex outermembrane recepter protein
VSVGKLPIKAMDLPQSIAVVGKDVIERQQNLRLSEVISNTTGIYVYGTSGGIQEEIGGRGYAFNSSNTFKNGVRYNNGAMPEISALEKVEILKGSAAILFGNVAAGGVLNLVTKKPTFEKGGEVSFRAGSYGFYKPAFDIYGPLNKSNTLAYRFNATYEKASSFRNEVNSERVYLNPSLLFIAGKKTKILAEGDFLYDKRTLDNGTGAVNYVIANVPRNRFLGAAWSFNKVKQQSATVTITHDLNSKWKLTSISSYQGYNSELFGTTRPNAGSQFVKEDGTWARGLQKNKNNEKYYITQLDLTGNFNTGKIAHTFLAGADADQYVTNVNAFAYTNADIGNKNVYDTINIYDLDKRIQRTDIPDITATTITHTPTKRYGVYVQDLISITEKLKLLAGLRYTKQMINGAYVDSLTKNKRTFTANTANDAFSPRLGLVYQPIKNISLFTSYSNSFTINTGTDIYLKPLAPSIIDQYEAGVKTELFKKMVSANVTFYKIINSNLAQVSLQDASGNANNNSNIKELAGEVTSKGVEADLSTRPIRGIQLMAGYSFNETKYSKSDEYIVGSKLRYNPQHTAHASVYYTFSSRSILNGFNIGIMSNYIGERVAGRSTRVRVNNDTYKLMSIPDYFQFDLSAGYLYQRFSVRAKVSNIFNKLSYYVHDDNSVNPIAPIQFSATVAYKF